VLGTIEVMLSDVLLGFDSVTFCGGEIVLTCTLPNDSFFGLMPILRPAANTLSGAATMMAISSVETTARFAVSISHLGGNAPKNALMMKLNFPQLRFAQT
jgi:hypothetical protein